MTISPLFFLLSISGLLGAEISFDVFSTRQGLIANGVTALYQEPEGYLWVGTEEGLCRFDGSRFEDMGLHANAPEGKIIALVGRGELLWIATRSRVVRFQDGYFETLYGDENARIGDLILDSEGRVWVNARNSIVMLHDRKMSVFTHRNGLPNHNLATLFADGTGIWAGFRSGGAARFAAGSWERFGREQGLDNVTVSGFYVAPDGKLWAATAKGLAYFDGTAFQTPSFNESLPTRLTFRVFAGGGNAIWANLSRVGAAGWDGERLRVLTPEDGLVADTIKQIHRDDRGRTWFFSVSGIGLLRDGHLEKIRVEEGLPSNRFTCFFDAGEGLIWVGFEYGLVRFEAPRMETFLEDRQTKALTSSSAARQIHRDRAGHLWFPSLLGMGYYDLETFRLFNKADGLPSNGVHHFGQDKDGGVWAGTDRGAALFDGSRWLPVQAMNKWVVRMVGGSGLWLLDGSGEAWQYHGERDTQGMPLLESIGSFNSVRDFTADEGILWIRTEKYLYRWDGKLEVTYLSDLIPEVINTALYRPGGRWWFGTSRGVYRYDGKNMDHFSKLGETENPAIDRILAGADGLWFRKVTHTAVMNVSRHTGLFRYDGHGFTTFRRGHELLSNDLEEIRVDWAGRCWLLSNKGLSLYQDGVFSHKTVADGLAGNRPSDLAMDNDGTLWIGTNGGINRYRAGHLTIFTKADGLLNDDVVDIEVDLRNDLWIRTRDGVQRYRVDAGGPRLVLNAFVDRDTRLPLVPSPVLAHDKNDLSFHVAAIDTRRGADQVHYSYELATDAGISTHFSQDSRFHLSHLKPGDYRLRVRAFNRDLTPGEQVEEVSFRIREPLWRRPWFLASMLVLVSLLAYLIYRFRLHGRLEQNRVQNELNTARQMQMSLMPEQAPSLDALDIHGVCVPAREVGGDFFDYFWLDEAKTRLGFTVMDVSGKSMEAAIIAVLTSGLVYSETSSGNPPAAMLSRINQPLFIKTGRKVFTTGLLASLHIPTHLLSFANAGHMDPIVIRKGAPLDLKAPERRDLPLGVMRRYAYQERELQLEPGDLVLLYTDGLNEATTHDGRLLGIRLVTEYLRSHHRMDAKALVTGLLEEVERFIGNAPRHDDITLIVVKIKA